MNIDYVEKGIAEILDKAKADGRCVDWEIDELVPLGGKKLGIKIGIYPWGKTIQYGTAGQLLAMVRDILREIDKNRFACPFCSTKQPLATTMQPQSECASCGAKFFVRLGRVNGNGILGEDCWPALRWALLHSGHEHSYKEASKAVRLVEEHREALEGVFSGVVTADVFGTIVHALSPDAKPLEEGNQPFHVRVASLLREAGFEEHTSAVHEYGEYREVRWFDGEVGDEAVVVSIGKLYDPGLTLAIDEEPSRIYEAAQGDDKASFDLTDEITEAWVDWALGCRSEGWQVSDGTVALGDIGSFPLAAYYKEPLPERVDSAWLQSTLEAGVRTCTAAAQSFLEDFDPERKLADLRSAYEKAAMLRERSLRWSLDSAVPSGSPAAAALALYLDKLASLEPHGWDDRAAVERAMYAVETHLGYEAAADLAHSQAAPLLWSKKLRRHIASRWAARRLAPRLPG
jgi:hypothetical protein